MEELTIYIIGLAMSYLVGNNYLVQKRLHIAGMYSNHTLNFWTSIGGFGGWFCILPAAIIIGTSYEYGLSESLLFLVAAFIGSILAGALSPRRMLGSAFGYFSEYILSALTLPINVILVLVLYNHLQ